MLTITIGGEEHFDNENNVFIVSSEFTLQLEHSLVSLSKWESKYKTPFLVEEPRSNEELLDYIRFMVIDESFDVSQINMISPGEMRTIDDYINSSESATTFGSMPNKQSSSERITSELIYYWMTAFRIPWEAQYWHLNRLFALIRICNMKQSPPKKRNAADIARWQREENARRLAERGTTG